MDRRVALLLAAPIDLKSFIMQSTSSSLFLRDKPGSDVVKDDKIGLNQISSKSSDESTPSHDICLAENPTIDLKNAVQTYNSERGIELSPTGDPRPESPPYSAFGNLQKTCILVLVTFAGFLGPLSGNIYIPIIPQLKVIFKTSEATLNGTVSVFMVVFAVAPLIWASWADFGGRKLLYLVSLSIFIAANVLLAVLPPNIGALYVLRVVQGIGASSVMSLGAGTVADVFEPRHRGKAISYFMLGPQLGPVLGPILSSVSSKGQWRWIFGLLAIFGLVSVLLVAFFLPETMRFLVGNGESFAGRWIMMPRLRQPKVVPHSSLYPKPPKPSVKGYWVLLQNKAVFICSFNSALLFASFYALSISFATVLSGQYKFTDVQTSVSYICPGISLVLGSLSGGRISDMLRSRFILKHPEKYTPEHRFSIQVFGLIISMAGILGYGWCIEKRVHVAAVFVFTFLGGFGMTWVFVTLTTYLTECSLGQPATMVAIGNFMRNLAAAVSAAVIDTLIKKMGHGWCFTGLAMTYLIALALVGCLIKLGPQWRRERESRTLKT